MTFNVENGGSLTCAYKAGRIAHRVQLLHARLAPITKAFTPSDADSLPPCVPASHSDPGGVFCTRVKWS